MTKIIQLSDMHLMASAEQLYRGIDVERRFGQCLDHVAENHGDADLLLLTGDLLHSGGAEGYQRIAKMLQPLSIPWHWIPGNHDDLTVIETTWGTMAGDLSLDGWKLTLLDSTANPDGLGSGSLAGSELDRLQTRLNLPGYHLVVLHHNPMVTESAWQDPIALGNRNQLMKMLHESGRSGALIFGHLHQQWDIKDGNWRLLSCPSTAVQFRKSSEHFVIEDQADEAWPGYRWLQLGAQGELTTAVERCAPDQ
ncbi:MAG: metallophosphoesterase [Motiliproteus sp.]|nr:metallophosphoesterase [Motiliproteus sp.]MCW9051547.1 metallophosphoesterase [Motiliproteus sp.]